VIAAKLAYPALSVLYCGHVTSKVAWLRFPIGHSLGGHFVTKPLSLTVSEIFNGQCDAMVDMTLNDLYARSRSFILVPIDSSYDILILVCQLSLNSNFCSSVHRTIHTSQTDGRNVA